MSIFPAYRPLIFRTRHIPILPQFCQKSSFRAPKLVSESSLVRRAGFEAQYCKLCSRMCQGTLVLPEPA